MKETARRSQGNERPHLLKHVYGFDDALYAAVRLIEAVAQSGKSLTNHGRDAQVDRDANCVSGR